MRCLYPPNDKVNAVGAVDDDFKIRVIAHLRSTLGSSRIFVLFGGR
jgi:hypothetical protein